MKFNKSITKEQKSSVADIFGFNIKANIKQSPNAFTVDFQ